MTDSRHRSRLLVVLRSGTTWSRQSSQVANLSEELEEGVDHYTVALKDLESNEFDIN